VDEKFFGKGHWEELIIANLKLLIGESAPRERSSIINYTLAIIKFSSSDPHVCECDGKAVCQSRQSRVDRLEFSHGPGQAAQSVVERFALRSPIRPASAAGFLGPFQVFLFYALQLHPQRRE
jgi:hypothetical protein